jgi:hypothetical protein
MAMIERPTPAAHRSFDGSDVGHEIWEHAEYTLHLVARLTSLSARSTRGCARVDKELVPAMR